jgi:SAM-dependent methyltransferase
MMIETNNNVTLNSYELGIPEYIARTAAEVTGNFKYWIDATLARLDTHARIVEIGSGFGRDARYIESRGFAVDRTDATEGFAQLLEQEGYTVRRFNVLIDNFSATYDCIFANAVFLHFTREELERVLEKAYAALAPQGLLAFSVKNGDGEEWTTAKIGHPRYFCYWRKKDIQALLVSKGFTCMEFFEDEKFLQITAQKHEVPGNRL